MMKRLGQEQAELESGERTKAAGIIQRNYRGHRERRMLAGMSLDPSSRWIEAVKEARYRQLTEPRPRAGMDGAEPSAGEGLGIHSRARENWKKIGTIARRAGGDEDSDHSSSSGEDESTPEQEREARRKRKMEQKHERRKAAKMMDLQYFLEMVDLKHRYGSNLRTYHEEWKKSETKENFFYWLDYGEGRYLDCQGCPRSRLDSEQDILLRSTSKVDYAGQRMGLESIPPSSLKTVSTELCPLPMRHQHTRRERRRQQSPATLLRNPGTMKVPEQINTLPLNSTSRKASRRSSMSQLQRSSTSFFVVQSGRIPGYS
jgi:hypothetical protein